MTTTRTILKGCPLVRTTTTQVLKHRKYGIHSASYSENSRFRCSHASAHANGPLSGIRILDLTRVLAVSFWYSYKVGSDQWLKHPRDHSVHRFSLTMVPRFSRLKIPKGVYVPGYLSLVLFGWIWYSPGIQDDTRLWRTAAEKDIWKLTGKDMSAYFCAINRNKMSITLNLKQDKGRKILFRLVKDSDVVSVIPRNLDSTIFRTKFITE